MLDDNQKIGTGLICLGLSFVALGVLMMFDASMIAIGNVLFLAGLAFVLGFKRAMTLFTRPDRVRGTVCFFLGIFLVVMRWGLLGMIIEGFGFLNLFGNFLPTIVIVARQLPGLGRVLDLPGISQFIDFLVGKTKPKFSA